MNNTETPLAPKEFTMYKLVMDIDKTISSDFIVDSLEKAIYLVNDYLDDYPNEVMICIALDLDRKPIGCSVVGVGNETSISNIKTNILRFALSSCADSIVLAHNHPRSSSLTMSNADRLELETLRQIATYLNIRVRDFIICGNQNHERAYFSWHADRVISQYEFIDSVTKNNFSDTPTLSTNKTDLNLHTSSIYNDVDSIAGNSDINESKSRKSLFSFFK